MAGHDTTLAQNKTLAYVAQNLNSLLGIAQNDNRGLCAGCLQPLGEAYEYFGKTIDAPSHVKPTKAHVISQNDGGRWRVDNLLMMHYRCNLYMGDESDREWNVSRHFSKYTTVANWNAQLAMQDRLHHEVLQTLDGKCEPSIHATRIIQAMAAYCLSHSDTAVVKKIYPRRMERIRAIAA